MVDECVFCRIANHATEASVVGEDAQTIAFMDVSQFHPGHTLVVPKQHIQDIFALDDKTGAAVMKTLTRLSRAVQEAFSPMA